ncbi:MAG TPA: YggT family protein [Anaerolineales bacterium]|nr:YggT family protein [Anaerolineales bacterium]
MAELATLINTLGNILILIVFVSALLSFFLPPYHPVREALDRIVDPMLNPIRRIIPTLGGLDFSPLILIILIQFVTRVLSALIYP